jgi:murein DD-endopeptidase MepM/ murein hydrolase activator NlpD
LLNLLKNNPGDQFVDFDAASITGIKTDQKYFAVVKYLNSATNRYEAIDAQYNGVSGYQIIKSPVNNSRSYYGNNPLQGSDGTYFKSGVQPSTIPTNSGTIKERYSTFYVGNNGVKPQIIVNGLKFQNTTEMIVEVYTPYVTTDGYPIVTTDRDNIGVINNLGIYKKIGTYNNYKTGYLDNNDSVPVVLGFGTATGTTQSQNTNGKLKYLTTYGDPFIPTGELSGSTQYQADVLGAISNGNSYISFIAIGLEDQIKSKIVLERTVRSYINKDVLGTKEFPKAYTILDKDITSKEIYIPPTKKLSNGKKTKVSGWVDPLKSITIGSGYGNRVLNGEPDFHRGIDLSTPVGTPVFSVLPGKVVYVGDSTGYGQVVIISHQDKGISTLYGHVSSINTSAGATVSAGDIIAKSGNIGKSTGPHLHLEIRKVVATNKDSYFAINKDGDEDPESYLSFNSASPDVKTVTPAETEANKIEIKNYLKGKGFSKIEVAAVLGNIHKETGGTFNPYSTNPKDENGFASLGLIQWNAKYIGGGIKDTEEAFKIIGLTVAAQMIYMTEGAWKNNTDRFRDAYKNKLSTIDTSGAKVTKRGKEGDKVANLKPEELNAYLAAFLFANIVEVCAGCNDKKGDNLSEQFKNYHIGAKAEQFEVWVRSETAVDYLKQMNNSSDKLKW